MSWLQDSSTYHAILDEGRAEGEARGEARGRVVQARRDVINLGTAKFGAPGPSIVATLDAIDDLEHLERLHRGVLTATSWTELLAAEPDR